MVNCYYVQYVFVHHFFNTTKPLFSGIIHNLVNIIAPLLWAFLRSKVSYSSSGSESYPSLDGTHVPTDWELYIAPSHPNCLSSLTVKLATWR